MNFGSVCSGIEAASVAWHSLGMTASWLAEIEAFPAAVLAHHYPNVPNLGDMTKIAQLVTGGIVDAPDVLVGGTPCQAFSLAGLRGGLADPRGGLTLEFVKLLDTIDEKRVANGEPECVGVWENVPGVLSSKDNAFGCFLAALAGEDDPLEPTGEKWTNAGVVYGPKRSIAWRILDAQYFGVAQRRRRVFLIASARKGFDPAAVLFEFDGMRRDIAPSRTSGETIAPTIRAGAPNGGAGHGARSGDSKDELIVPVDAVVCMAHGQGGAEISVGRSPTLTCNHEAPIAAYGFQSRIGRNGRGDMGDVAHALSAQAGETGKGDAAPCVAYSTKLHNTNSNGAGKLYEEYTVSLDHNSPPPALLTVQQVRRLIPEECEALQGFPRSYTAIPWRNKPAEQCPDGPRYKALGNSMAVPCMRWIGQRLLTELAITNKLCGTL